MEPCKTLAPVRPHWALRVAVTLVAVLCVVIVFTTPATLYASSPLPYVPLAMTVVVFLRAVDLLTLELELDDHGVTLTSLLRSRFVAWRDDARVLWGDAGPLRPHSSRVVEATVLLTGAYLFSWLETYPPGTGLVGLLSTLTVAAGVSELVEASLAWTDRREPSRPPLTSARALADDTGCVLLVPRTFRTADVARLREIVAARRESELRRPEKGRSDRSGPVPSEGVR